MIKGTPPIPRDSHSCTTVGDNLYVFGGTDGMNPLRDLHILDTCEQFLTLISLFPLVVIFTQPDVLMWNVILPFRISVCKRQKRKFFVKDRRENSCP